MPLQGSLVRFSLHLFFHLTNIKTKVINPTEIKRQLSMCGPHKCHILHNYATTANVDLSQALPHTQKDWTICIK